MQMDNLLHAAQANPRAKHCRGHIAAAAEALEYVRQVLRLDADALVLNGDDDAAGSACLGQVRVLGLGFYLPATDFDHDPATVRAVLKGVAQQVVEHATESALIPETWRRAGSRVEDKLVLVGQRLVALDALRHDLDEIATRQLERERGAFFEGCHRDDLIDE